MRWAAALLLLVTLAVGTSTASATAPAPGPYLVLLVLDGARPDYFNVPNIPHVRALIQSGTQYTNAWAGILESETPSGHATIGTGSQPRNDGILSFAWAGSDNVPVNLFNPSEVRSGAMEKIIRASHVPTLAWLVHRQDPRAKVVSLSGHKYYAADAMGGPDADVIMYYAGTSNGTFAPTAIPGHIPPAGVLTTPSLTVQNRGIPLGVEDHLAMKLAIKTFKRMRQRVTLINLPEFDWPLGHVDGADRDESAVKVLMQGFDRDLAALERAYRQAGVLDRTIFMVTADHGMAPLAHKVSSTDLTGAVGRAGTTLVSQAYSSGAYLWVRDKARALLAADYIASLRNPYIQSVYVKTRSSRGFAYERVSSSLLLKTPGVDAANQTLLDSFSGPAGPDIVVLFTEDSGSEPGGQAGWKADHGGANWQAQHIPLIIAGPGVRHDFVSSYPARLEDLAPTALQLMGMPHKGMQGIPLADAMQSPPSWAVQWQRGQRPGLAAAVAALQQESALELKGGL